ncbi:MAG: NAD(P)/FAD-dependent oxidoreductase [Halodesulfurarchaeum sp.]
MRVAVFGGGYAGIVAATRLEERLPADASVVLVDRRERHLIRHELHRVIRRPGFADTIQVPFATILDRATVRQESVSSIDADAGKVTFESGETLSYDAGVLALGSRPTYDGLEGVNAHGLPLASPADATAIGESMAELLDSGAGTVVVGGGGLAGVQVAGELAALRADRGADSVPIRLLEQAPEIVPEADPRFREELVAALEARDVEVHTGRAVSGADESVVHLAENPDVPYDLFVWTGGIQGQAALGGERPMVRADLRLGDRTFGAGDAVRAVDEDGELAPATAQAAVSMGQVAADNALIRAEADDESGVRPAYHRYRDRSESRVASVGDAAVAQLGPVVVTGPPARALKSVVGIRYLSAAAGIERALSVVRGEFGLADPRTGRDPDRLPPEP